MLEYWRNAQAPREKFANEYLLTGDISRIDDDGIIFAPHR
jgi:acetyl-CoA synthetase